MTPTESIGEPEAQEPELTPVSTTKPASKPAKARAPKREAPGRPPAGAAAARQATQTIGLGLTLIDGAAAFIFPKAWTEDDRLKTEEVDRLLQPTMAILNSHPKWAAAVVSLGEKSEYVALAAAVASVALPRMLRHHMLPEGIALMLASTMGMEMPAPPNPNNGQGPVPSPSL